MNSPARILLTLSTVIALTLPFAACTTGSIKGTIKATTDPTTDISSSTSGKTWFTEEGLVRDDYRITAFTTINFENLKDEMARGHGEYLASLGTLLGVADIHRAEFYALTQEKYSLLVSSDRTTPDQMVAALNRELAAHPPVLQAASLN